MEFSAKTVNDAITEACTHFTVASDRLDYEVLEEGSSGFLGLGSKAAKIKARVKEEAEMMAEAEEKAVKEIVKEEKKAEKEAAKEWTKEEKKEVKEAKAKAPVNAKEVEDKSIAFLKDVLHAMDIAAVVEAEYDSNEELLNINLIGEDMGILIGKRGQTLDSLQYLVSLVVNKEAGG